MSVAEQVRRLFLDELRRRGITLVRELPAGGMFVVEIDGRELTVNLESVTRDYQRDGNLKRVVEWLNTFFYTSPALLPWSNSAEGLRFLAERADLDLDDAIVERQTPALSRVLVHIEDDESAMHFVTAAQLKAWDQSRETIVQTACKNMNRLLAEAELDFEWIDNLRVGTLCTYSVFKSSLIFAPNLKSLVAAKLGWPVLAVIPCRDFLYLISATDVRSVGKLSKLIAGEYSSSSDPITTEVLQISDKGIKAIGEFSVRPR